MPGNLQQQQEPGEEPGKAVTGLLLQSKQRCSIPGHGRQRILQTISTPVDNQWHQLQLHHHQHPHQHQADRHQDRDLIRVPIVSLMPCLLRRKGDHRRRGSIGSEACKRLHPLTYDP